MSLMEEKDNKSLEIGAATDIVRLRWRLKVRENIIGRLVAETGRLRLTDEERAAILAAADLLIGSKPGVILRNLLARLS